MLKEAKLHIRTAKFDENSVLFCLSQIIIYFIYMAASFIHKCSSECLKLEYKNTFKKEGSKINVT